MVPFSLSHVATQCIVLKPGKGYEIYYPMIYREYDILFNNIDIDRIISYLLVKSDNIILGGMIFECYDMPGDIILQTKSHLY